MGRSRRISGVAIALVVAPSLVFLSTGSIASADATVTQPSKVTASNWFYNSGVTLPIEVPVPLPVTIPENPVPPGILIPNGDLAVSSKSADAGNAPDRETYLMFSLAGAHDPAKITSFTFTVFTDTSNLTNFPPGAIPLIACLPTRIWDPGPGSVGFSQKPIDDCSDAPKATYNAAAKSYTFQIKDIAQEWVDGSMVGVSIRHAETYKTPFILALKGPSTVTAKISYEQLAGPASVITTPILPITPTDVIPQVAVPAPPVPDLSTTTPATPTTPTLVAPQVASPLTAASASVPIGHTTYDSRFWIAVIVGLLGLLVVGYFLGRRPKQVVIVQEKSKLSQVLSARSRSGPASNKAR